MLDTGIEKKAVQKSGSYFSFGDERLGQGRQNATAFLEGASRRGAGDPARDPGAGAARPGDLGEAAAHEEGAIEVTPVLDEEEEPQRLTRSTLRRPPSGTATDRACRSTSGWHVPAWRTIVRPTAPMRSSASATSTTPASQTSALRRSPTEATATRRSGHGWRPTASAEVVGEAVGGLRPEIERAAEIVATLGASPERRPGSPGRGSARTRWRRPPLRLRRTGQRCRVPTPDDESPNPETVRFFLQSSVSPIESTVPVSHDFSHRAPRRPQKRPHSQIDIPGTTLGRAPRFQVRYSFGRVSV